MKLRVPRTSSSHESFWYGKSFLVLYATRSYAADFARIQWTADEVLVVDLDIKTRNNFEGV